MNELFDSLFGTLMDSAATGTTYSYMNAPRVDVIEGDNNYTLEMELPGRSENDVNIELHHDNLTIASKTEDKKEKEDKNKKNEKFLLRERRSYDFSRRFTLPQDVDQDSIKANFKNGILTINMQKKAKVAPKTIAIEAC